MERDEHFERLRSQDPAAEINFDAHATLARVDARIASSSTTFGQRTRRVTRGMQYLAAAAALAVFAGGGYLTGVEVASPASTTEAVAASGDASMKLAGAGGPDSASSSSSYAGWYGNTVLKPTAAIPNEGGTAAAFGFDDADLDRLAFAKQLARTFDLDESKVKQEEFYVGFSEQDGVSVERRPQASFWVNNNARSPWGCGVVTDGNAQPRPADEQARIDADCVAAWPRPTDAEALTQARAVLKQLQVPGLAGADLTIGWSDDRSVSIVATQTLNGVVLRGIETTVMVGAKGAFSVNGTAAKLSKVGAYPIDGARDVALRSLQRKWAAFGPSNISTASGAMPFEGASSATPVTLTRNGLPMPQAMLAEVEVVAAKPGVQMIWFPSGETVFLPTWDYTARDGSVWQMLAIAEEYVDWSTPLENPVLSR